MRAILAALLLVRAAFADDLAALLAEEKTRPADAALLSRIADACGESMAGADSRAEKTARGGRALDYARRAVAADDRSSAAQLSLAMAYGRLAELQDNKTKIAWSRLVKLHAGKALALDPANETACHVLGCWHYELANLNPVLRALARVIYGRLPDASNAEAAALFQKAIALNPRRARNHIELGRTYAAMGRTADARAMLEKGLATPSHDADDTDAKARARKALDAL